MKWFSSALEIEAACPFAAKFEQFFSASTNEDLSTRRNKNLIVQ